MSPGKKQSWPRAITKILKQAVRDEWKTDAGRINCLGMLLVGLLAFIYITPIIFNVVIQSIRSLMYNRDISISSEYIWSLFTLGVLTLICMTFLIIDQQARTKSK